MAENEETLHRLEVNIEKKEVRFSNTDDHEDTEGWHILSVTNNFGMNVFILAYFESIYGKKEEFTVENWNKTASKVATIMAKLDTAGFSIKQHPKPTEHSID